jgi:hypothetical protein
MYPGAYAAETPDKVAALMRHTRPKTAASKSSKWDWPGY